ncbi:type VI secretion system effector Tse5 [Pseudomonas aeruginosa]|uniref:type VI secretion system effector Tse5 n=1 Tax=Pseudomonas aeruginosa TaxID=287 RepID=UPI00209FB411|nr:type VI secretion system effector Tse5 [Pseudomonas aeruginosa]EME5356882.1 RHS repeat protein [Pseudomonas aeruginosa]MCO5622213.1 type VI secretion system effector Tse5 [Pseudomonas aeruginosa]
MSGLPVSHVGEKVSGGVISTGSPTVHVGSSAVGLADRASACVPLVGKPVNPMLGSKLLPEEVDFALAAPDTFTFARGYLSSNPRIGRLGRGWWLPGESMHLELSEDACVLVDAQGRRIGFPALAPGAQHYSGSEELWLRRGGSSGGAAQAWRGRWAAVPAELQTQEGSVLVLSGHSYLHFQRCPDGIWRLQASFGRAGYRTEFRWSGRGLLTGVRDSAGRSYALVYQQACEPSEGDDGLRLFGVILASHDGPPPDYIDPQSPGLDWLVRYQFSDSGDLIAVRDRLGQVVRVFAWREHMLVAHGEPGGLEVRYEWDVHAPHGRVVKQIEAGGLTRTFRYLRDATEVSDSLGRVERYEFAGEGGQRRWTALVRADGSRSEFDYDLFGRLVAMRDPLGRETRRRRDGQGRMLEEESPGKARYRKRVDEETGLLVELEDAMQRRWTFERDERGNATTVRGPAGSTRYAYEDPRLPDRPTRIVDPRGGERRLEWNRFGLLAALTDCSGQVWRYDYDNEGRLVASSDPLGQLTRRRYDPLGQLIGLELADGSALSYEYDALGRQTRIADAEGHATLFSWGHGDLLARVSAAGGGELSYLHDEAGRLVALTNENGVQAQFRYDLLDRLVEETGFDGRRQRYRYNAADELIAREDADGRETTYAYDRDGRLASIRVPATEHAPALVERYRWLPDGRLASAGGADCEVRYTYDEVGNLRLESQVHADGWVYSVEHSHDALGVRQTSRYGDAPPVAWLTYGPGHLHGALVGAVELAFERDALHREVRRDARRDGQDDALFTQERQHAPLGRLQRSRLRLAGGFDWQRGYRYDGLGQLVGIDDNQYPSVRYEYDLGGRLLASRRAGAAASTYRYDAAGNRLEGVGEHAREDARQAFAENELYRSGFSRSEARASQAGEGPARWAGNRVERIAGNRYRFDALGNLVERIGADGERLCLAYDGAQRLVHLSRDCADGTRLEARYRYDALSRRIAKVVLREGVEQQVRFGWDGDRQCAEAFARELRTTVHEPGGFVPLLRLEQACEPDPPELLQLRQAFAAEGQPLPAQCVPALGEARVAFFHTDHLGTPLQLSDERGQLHWQGVPDDWRAVAPERQPGAQPIRFQGQYHDEESGLYYNRYRYYLPEAGRYASQDPLGLGGGPNPYAYALNAPTLAYDPTGLIIPLVVIGAFAARAAIGAALGAGIELGMQTGKQVLGQMKDNWDNDRDLTDIKWKCIDINWKHVGASAAIGTVAPGMLSTGKTVVQSAKAIRTLSGQAANTANRAAKLAARKAAHADTIKKAVATQAAWQTGKQIVKCPLKDEEEECPPQ